MQYARHIAELEPGPVALLRLRSGEGTLELLGTGAGEALGNDRRFASLKEAAEHLAGQVAAWLIRVEETAEPVLADLTDLTQLTLLSGADEAATVAAYRAIKHLVPSSDDDEGPTIRLAMMGAAADHANNGAAKLARAAEAFLQRKVEVTACVAKIAGGQRSELAWSGRVEAPIEETLGWLVRTIHSRPFSMPKTTLAPTTTPLAAAAVQVNAVAASKPPAPSAPTARPVAPSTPSPAPVVPAMRDVAPLKSGLLSRHLPTLRALGITCPYASGVELATADDGTIHLLALEGAAADQPALPRLMTAAAWVRDHLALLKLAAPAEGRKVAEAEPILHLLTTSAPTVRRLTDSGLRLHVLVSSKTGDETVWACADLN
jgi:hypothetical protein